MAFSSAVEQAQEAPVFRAGVSEPNSETPSIAVSPLDSPNRSLSVTSMSSIDENIDPVKPTAAKGPMAGQKGKKAQLVDTHGNPFELPDFTIQEIRNAIPKHCFERSAVRSLSYLLRDFVCLATTFVLFHNFVTPELVPFKSARVVLWGVYTVLQGLFGTGVWVLAHECGHQAFSPSRALNDFVGWVCHSLLLVPYFSWKFSHSKHHKATGNLARDMVFVPKTREQFASRVGKLAHQVGDLMDETPIMSAGNLLVQQLFGWPMYLITNVTGHNEHAGQREGKGKGKKNGWFGGVNHFDMRAPIFDEREEKWVLASDLGLLLTGSLLYFVGSTYGWSNLAVWYFIPYLWVNHWLVAITYLQHTDPQLPHYQPDAWNFARGAAATIDREFGFVGRTLLHGIIETHVLHHYVSTIPFYNADEASEAIKSVMGIHYRSDTRNGAIGFLNALWTSSRWCQWVEPMEGAEGENKSVLFYRNSNGLGVAPAKA